MGLIPRLESYRPLSPLVVPIAHVALPGQAPASFAPAGAGAAGGYGRVDAVFGWVLPWRAVPCCMFTLLCQINTQIIPQV